MIPRFFTRSRLKQARRQLAEEFSAENYARLIQQLAMGDELEAACELCREGLEHFAGDRTLQRLDQRVQRHLRERRLARLRAELEQGPRPALWIAFCDLCSECGEWDEAERAAELWRAQDESGSATLLLARIRTRRFLADRSRSAGEAALAAITEARTEAERGAEALQLELRMLLAIGAFSDAREVVRELLDHFPGDTDLEARYRALEGPAQGAPDPRRALARVEETGRLATDHVESSAVSGEVVRPALQRLAAAPGCGAALFMRGSTALIQGPRGATAQRTARGMKSALKAARAVSRRLDLGPLRELEVEGDFGQLVGAVGERDVAVAWYRRTAQPAEREALRELAGAPSPNDNKGLAA
jgi:tetratricopeptide (TPR) repeat protein